ncbi:glucose-6-phosphate dehydrogenase [Methylocaldum sp.]|uniref:glucose-6-phosphate dehydrogenase n=1 Tax=Methylocaldum sp. TaxID=1969727 RepID=UPI002D3264F5|nr:glucose-6-phosphate dehydrogenase [Methylocaldum sp.]HYE34591.1 glucose-6-phosphate dehydrogenase [Methylocaldum sp.]
MQQNGHQHGIVFVLFGFAGDLAWRLIMPALYQLYSNQDLPERFLLVGIDRLELSNEELAKRSEKFQGNRRSGERWPEFIRGIRSLRGDLSDPAIYQKLHELIKTQEHEWKEPAQRVYYMATPPFLFSAIAKELGAAGLHRYPQRSRIVVEKPLGHDIESYRAINEALKKNFQENQIFRIDHFLGKETVQNILALRFANPIFEPIWDRRYIDHVAITVAETLGVEHRGGYYDRAGALRDMVQNHLMQLFCLVAMEPPAAYEADDIRSRKMDVMHALRPISSDQVFQRAIRGQYGAGWIKGREVKGYRDEPGIAPDSSTETFAALKLYVDNWRWQDVPFYLRTGKRMAADVSEISIRFRPVPHRAFPASASEDSIPVSLVLRLQPKEEICLNFYVKEPGSRRRLHPVQMNFNYCETFKIETPPAYETLLRDVMAGDPGLFMRADQVEASWRLLMPVLDVWAENRPANFPNYAAGSTGPESADTLTAMDGHSWLTPLTTGMGQTSC